MSPATNDILVTTSPLKLVGQINPRDKLTINGEELVRDASGHFEKEFPLQDGVNTAEFKVKRFLGKETTVVRQIIYKATQF